MRRPGAVARFVGARRGVATIFTRQYDRRDETCSPTRCRGHSTVMCSRPSHHRHCCRGAASKVVRAGAGQCGGRLPEPRPGAAKPGRAALVRGHRASNVTGEVWPVPSWPGARMRGRPIVVMPPSSRRTGGRHRRAGRDTCAVWHKALTRRSCGPLSAVGLAPAAPPLPHAAARPRRYTTARCPGPSSRPHEPAPPTCRCWATGRGLRALRRRPVALANREEPVGPAAYGLANCPVSASCGCGS